MTKKAKKTDDTLGYKIVIGGFCLVCIAAVLYVILQRNPAPETVRALDWEAIQEHNVSNKYFQRGNNTIFTVHPIYSA
jgi:hypothetical protein